MVGAPTGVVVWVLRLLVLAGPPAVGVALTLAVGNIIGGNTFDTMLVGVADVAYREGSVYAASAASSRWTSASASS